MYENEEYKEALFKDMFNDFNHFMVVAEEFEIAPNFLDYFFFKRLFREYANYATAYETPHDFYGAFFNDWEDAVFEMSKKKELSDILIAMSELDYTKDYTLGTIAQNPNEKPNAPQELLQYFNTQNYNESNMKKVEAYSRAYQLVPKGIVLEFIVKFKHLFMSCHNSYTDFYKNF